MAVPTPFTVARLWSKVEIPPCPSNENLCWIWSGSTAKGYGQIKSNGKVERTHRVAYEAVHGEIPEGMQVLHKCDTPLCVNPAHLRLGTMPENMAEMAVKGRTWKGGPYPKAG